MPSLYDFTEIDETTDEILNDVTQDKEIDTTGRKKTYGGAHIYVTPITFNDILFSPIPQLKCIQCGFYGRTFYCGPWVAPYYKWRKVLSNFNLFIMVAGYIDVTPRIEDNMNNFGTGKFHAHYFAGNEGSSIIKSDVNKYSEYIRNKLRPISKKIFMYDVGGGCRRAVLPETTLHTNKGIKMARDITKGDILLGYNLDDEKYINNEIIDKNRRRTPKKIIIRTESGKKLRVSFDHPVLTDKGWKKAYNITIDDRVLVKGLLKWEKLSDIEVVDEESDCFDIEVTGTHNFFADNVLVHNCRLCAKHTGEKCKHPHEANIAPEASGVELYSMLSQLHEGFQVPPINKFWSSRIIVANVIDKDYNPEVFSSHNLKIVRNDFEVPEAVEVYNVEDIYNSELSKDCEDCDQYSSLLCDRSKYLEEDLYEAIKDRKLYKIKLKNSNKTIKGVKELHRYQLDVHRKGAWWSFHLLPHRCPVCEECNIDIHRETGYKKLTNRHIPFCLKYFNLDIRDYDDYTGFILV